MTLLHIFGYLQQERIRKPKEGMRARSHRLPTKPEKLDCFIMAAAQFGGSLVSHGGQEEGNGNY